MWSLAERTEERDSNNLLYCQLIASQKFCIPPSWFQVTGLNWKFTRYKCTVSKSKVWVMFYMLLFKKNMFPSGTMQLHTLLLCFYYSFYWSVYSLCVKVRVLRESSPTESKQRLTVMFSDVSQTDTSDSRCSQRILAYKNLVCPKLWEPNPNTI